MPPMRTLAHIGIPVKEKPANSAHLPGGIYVSDPSLTRNRVEFLFFEEPCAMPTIVKTTAHIAYETPDLSSELDGAHVLVEPFEPFPGVKAAFVLEDGIPVELVQKTK